VDREPLPLLCLPAPAVRVTVTCKSPKIRKAVGFSFFSFWFTDLFVSVLGLLCPWFRLLLCFVVLCWLQVRPCGTASVEEEPEEAGAAARGAARHCWLKKAGSSSGRGRDDVYGRCCG
jgi:hypothetical protein